MATVEVFACNECGRTFKTHMALIGHQGYHRNVGRYQCELCMLEDGLDVVFTLPQGLGAHMRAKHPEHAKEIVGNGKKEGKLWVDTEIVAKVLAAEAEEPKPEPSEIETLIDVTFAPLFDRYAKLQERVKDLDVELKQVDTDLRTLWDVLKAVPGAEKLSPPASEGVQVAFQKRVSDNLKERFDLFLEGRKQSFTVTDLERALGISVTTGAKLVADYREEGKVRLVGKRGRAHTYTSTLPGAR